MFDVVGCGCTAWDMLCITPEYPGLDVKIRVDDLVMQGGGLIATALVAVARLGGKAAIIGKVGDDDWGRFQREELIREGVDVRNLVIGRPGDSHFAFVVVDAATGKRTIFYKRGDDYLLRPDQVDRALVESAKALLVDGHQMDAGIAAAARAKQAGIPVVMDAEGTEPRTPEMVNLTDYLIPSRECALAYTGCEDVPSAAQKLAAGGRHRAVVVTLGDQGALIVADGEVTRQPAFAVDVVDTTGAGDVFHGAFAFALSRGDDVRQATRFAAAVAALKCRKLGGRAGIPSLAETEALLAQP
jgi:sugar/nucleoside kinase (ribokinase family)